MEGKVYSRTIGLPLDTWRLVEEAQFSRLCREVLGKYPTESQVIAWLVRLAQARMDQLTKEVDLIQESMR